MTSLLLIAAALALVAGLRLSRYYGIPLRVWWAEQRMYRRPGEIGRRLGRAVVAVSLLTASIAALLFLIGVVFVAITAVGLTVAVWYGLRLAAARATPPVYPVERFDLDLPEPVPGNTFPDLSPRDEIDPRPSSTLEA